MKKKTNGNWMTIGALIISVLALILALTATQSINEIQQAISQKSNMEMKNSSSLIQTAEMKINQITSKSEQTGQELSVEIQELRNELAIEYQNAEENVQAAWKNLDEELEVIQEKSKDNTVQALEELQELIEEAQKEIQ